MHLGALGVVANNSKSNFKYILINNGSHESVGGQPTIAFNINLSLILTGLGFSKVFEISSIEQLNNSFYEFNLTPKSVLIINVKQGSRNDLGRPTTTPQQNKEAFMKFVQD